MNKRQDQDETQLPADGKEQAGAAAGRRPASAADQAGAEELKAPPAMYAREGDPSLLPDEDEDEPADQPHAFAQFVRRTAAPAVAEPDDTPTSPLLPKQPRSLLDVGLSKAFLTDLALKIIHYSGTPALPQLIRRIGLGLGLVQQVISTPA